MLFADYTKQNEQGLYEPDLGKFIKVRFPYSSQVKNMITNLIDKKDPVNNC